MDVYLPGTLNEVPNIVVTGQSGGDIQGGRGLRVYGLNEHLAGFLESILSKILFSNMIWVCHSGHDWPAVDERLLAGSLASALCPWCEAYLCSAVQYSSTSNGGCLKSQLTQNRCSSLIRNHPPVLLSHV